MKLAAHRIINGERKAQGERQICSPSLIQNESGDKMMLQKKKSGFILLEAVLAILLMSMASYGLAMISALQFNQLEAKQVANEAEQYAMNEVEYLRRVGFYDLDEALHDRKSNFEFSGVDGWESVTSFVTEKAIDDDRSIKIAKVEVYKEGENIPRYSMEVPLSSESNRGELVGTIIPRMSEKFASEYEARQYLLCDGSTFDTTKYKRLYQVLGTNKLPNLQGVFLRGYGTQGDYSSGQLGQVQGDAMRKIYGDIPTVQHGDSIFGTYTPGALFVAGHGYDWALNTGRAYGYNTWLLPQFKNYRYRLSGNKESGYSLLEYAEVNDYQVFPQTVRWADGNPQYGAHAYRTVTLDSSRVVPTDKETRPANVAVKYFIRAK